MMTLILIVSFLLIAFVGLLRYDIHKHKYLDPQKPDADKKEVEQQHHNKSQEPENDA